MRILITNIKQLIQTDRDAYNKKAGKEMATLNSIENAYLLINEDVISAFGDMNVCPVNADKIIDASGKMVFPCWCDSHTHIVYAGSRENEFIDKIKGLSYEEIAKRGGGILNSAKRLQHTSEKELFESAWKRLEEMKAMGTGAVEIKSGYGLTVQDELKMLRVIAQLKEASQLTIKSTFLGAHAFPVEYKQNRQAYVDLIIKEMLPVIGQEKLADYCDVFCDRGFFSVKETDQILNAATKYGLKPKIHANELDYSGGIQVGVKNNAISVDHLEFTGDNEIEALLHSNTMPTLLPSTAFFLGLHYPPARKMIDAGLPIALASDYNPGSSPSGNMSFVLSLACIKLKMLPEEAINAATINGAYAMEVNDKLGSIAVGKKANIFITKPISSYALIPYSFGSCLVETVIVNGIIQ